MKKNISMIMIFGFLFGIVFIGFLLSIKSNYAMPDEETDIEEVLRGDAYSYLPNEAKDYIRSFYERTGEIVLTDRNKENHELYLNPEYVDYLSHRGNHQIVPDALIIYDASVVNTNTKEFSYDSQNSTLPAVFNLNNFNGKNFVTPFKNQGDEGLCWDYATNAHLESKLLLLSDKSYDANSVILSEKQVDYATAGWNELGIIGFNTYNCYREGQLSDGGTAKCAAELMLDGFGFVSKSWDTLHKDAIKNSKYLKGSEIYNSDNSLYEANSTNFFDNKYARTHIDEIKREIMQYGGAVIITDINLDGVSVYNGSEISTIFSTTGSVSAYGSAPHAMEVVGWDDNFEFSACVTVHGPVYPEEDCPDEIVHSKGVWIVKNSWGEYDLYKNMLVGYASLDYTVDVIEDISERSWDNSYQLNTKKIDGTTKEFSFKASSYVVDEKLNKIKVHLSRGSDYSVYIKNGNSSYQLLRTVSSTTEGYNYLDLSNENITINKNTKFKIVSSKSTPYDFRVYTNNINNTVSVKSTDIVYNEENQKLFPSHRAVFTAKSLTKNIPDGGLLTFKIKDSNNEYISRAGYSYELNDVYANQSNVKLTINSDYFDIGNYTVLVYYNNVEYTSFALKIQAPLVLIQNGDGSADNPWQITTATEFNYIRMNPYDSYILMNDIDFEYDTNNPKGKFYNDGNGFEVVEEFYGYFNGNGHQLKNIHSRAVIDEDQNVLRQAGIFSEFKITASSYNEKTSSCKFTKCGVYNLKVVNPTFVGASDYYGVGGIIRYAKIQVISQFIFDKNAVIGGTITNVDNEYFIRIGGLIGTLYIDSGDYENVSHNLTMSNLYNSANITLGDREYGARYVSGIIGYVDTGDDDYSTNLILKNVMNEGIVVSNDSDDYYANAVSNILNVGSDFGSVAGVTLTNVVDLKNPNNFIIASVPEFNGERSKVNVVFNNVYTVATNTISSKSKVFNRPTENNVRNGLLVYEIANADYSNWNGFSDYWYQYDDGVKRVPVLKLLNRKYTTFSRNVKLAVGQTVNVPNIVNNYPNMKVVTKCTFDLDICQNITDNNILSLKNSSVSGLALGSTTLIAYNETDGYIGLLNVAVSEEAQTYTVTFNANGGSGTMAAQIFQQWEEANLSANKFTRDWYTFGGWNTKSDGTGSSYKDGQKISIAEDMTLYATWTTVDELVIDSYDYNKDEKYISSIPAGTMVDEFSQAIHLSDGYSMKVDYKEINKKKVLYTGGKAKIYKNNNLFVELTNIVTGDVNGNGEIDIIDYIKIKKDIMEIEKLNGVYLLAADMNGNNTPDIIDYIRIKKIIMEEE